MLTERERVALQVFDDLTEKGVLADHAAAVAQQVREHLDRDRTAPELIVARVTDHAGGLHACVLPTPPSGSLPLFKIDLVRHRARARRTMIEELAVDTVLDDPGTKV